MKPKMSVKFDKELTEWEISFTNDGIHYKRRLLFFDEMKPFYRTLETSMTYKELIKLFEERGEKEKVFDQVDIEIID